MYEPTLNAKQIGKAPLPAAAKDSWLLVVYVTGAPTDASAADTERDTIKLLDFFSWKEPPKGNLKLGTKAFRFGSEFIALKVPDPADAIAKTKVYIMLLAPREEKDRWDLAVASELGVIVPSYAFMKLCHGDMAGTGLPVPDQSGIAAFRLCAFMVDEGGKQKLVPVSTPAVLRLDGQKLGKPGPGR